MIVTFCGHSEFNKSKEHERRILELLALSKSVIFCLPGAKTRYASLIDSARFTRKSGSHSQIFPYFCANLTVLAKKRENRSVFF